MQALKKLPGVESAVVDFKGGKVDIAWKAGKPFDYEALRRTTGKVANFTLRAVELTVVGQVEQTGESTVLKATDTSDVFFLKGFPATASGTEPYEVSGKLESPATKRGQNEGPKPSAPKTASLPLTLQVQGHRTISPAR